MKISYVTLDDATDIHSWSGLNYHISQSLINQNNELTYIGSLETLPGPILTFKKYFYYAFGKSFAYEREPKVARGFAAQILDRLPDHTDLIFGPGSIPLALLDTSLPKVFYTDATFAGMTGFYEGFSRYSKETIQHGNYLEQEALSSCALAIYSSEWAARTALENYQVDPGKVKVVPYGANVECNRTAEDIRRIADERSADTCKLFFIGVEWDRKRGNFAVEIAGKLNEMGVKTELHMAGLKEIPMNPLPHYVINHGFISKASEEGKKKLNSLFSESHFLLLPSKAEACAVVFAEACSFGLPIISTNVGGVTTAVKDEISGKAFSLSAPAEDYATYIERTFHDRKRYKELAASSFNEYKSRLNWEVAGKEVMKLLKDL